MLALATEPTDSVAWRVVMLSAIISSVVDIPITSEDQEVYLRTHDASSFIDAVARSQTEGETSHRAAPVLLTLQAFYREPEVLYVALDYARTMGVEVRVVTVESESAAKPRAA